jgi:hypothetical protein
MAREMPPPAASTTRVFHVSIRTRAVAFTGAAQVSGCANVQEAERRLRIALGDEDLVRIELQGVTDTVPTTEEG